MPEIYLGQNSRSVMAKHDENPFEVEEDCGIYLLPASFEEIVLFSKANKKTDYLCCKAK